MPKSTTLRSKLAAVACAMFVSAHAFSAPHQLDIPPGPLVPALEALEKQVAIEFIFQPDQLRGFRTQGLNGAYEPEAAIKLLLTGTPLQVYTDSNGAMVIALPRASASTGSQPSPAPRSPAEHAAQQRSSLPSRKLDKPPKRPPATNNGVTSSYGPGGIVTTLQEVIVTAQKRSQRLEDVPIPVTVVDTRALVSNGALRLQDYYTSVPGFVVAPTGSQTSQILAIRGLATGEGAPTVGVVIDDIPYGSSTALGGGQGIPDIDPGDLAQIEVLRGPQGTLYGANSLGGLIKIITLDPSTKAVSGDVSAGTDWVVNGTQPGYDVRGSVNMPVSDTVAVRASGFRRMEPGWIDQPARDLKGVNEEVADGGMLSAMWSSAQGASFKLDAMYQKTEDGAVSSVDVFPGAAPLTQAQILDTRNSKEVQFYAGVLKLPMGPATLTSLTGYNISSFNSQADASFLYGAILMEPLFGVDGALLTGDARTSKLSQELRLATPIGTMWDWLLGVYFTREDTQFLVNLPAVNPQTQQTVGSVLNSDFPTKYKEYAAYTDITYKLGPRFDVQFGGRYTKFKQQGLEEDQGIYNTLFFYPPRTDPFIAGPLNYDSDSFTYLITPQLKVNPDLMVYARLASGYRAGGINTTVSPGVPSGYAPDKTQNFELGVKGDWLQHRLSVDASLYYIDWKSIQLFLASKTRAGYFANGGDAKSQGLELAVQGKPTRGLTLGGWVAWNDAVLTQNLPASSTVEGMDGDRLPYNVRFSGSLTAEQDFALPHDAIGFVGADVSYLGARVGEFVASGSRVYLPAYAKTDVHAGLRLDTWSLNLFGNNITDRRAILTRGQDAAGDPTSVNFIEPRSIGLNIAKSF